MAKRKVKVTAVEIRYLARAREWVNGMGWVWKSVTGLVVGSAVLWGAVRPLVLLAGDQVNVVNEYAKRPWVLEQVDLKIVPIASGVGSINALVLIKWWGENRRGILALEGKRQRGVLTAGDLRELNDLYNERDMLQREFQKAKLPVPSTP